VLTVCVFIIYFIFVIFEGAACMAVNPSHDAPHLQRVPDGQQRVLGVRPSSLAGRAQVVVGTHRTLEAGSHHGALAAVTGDITVQWGGGQVMGSTLRSSRRRWVAEGEGREGVKRKVSTILLLL